MKQVTKIRPHKLAVFTIPDSLMPDENNQFLSGWTEYSAGMLDPWILYDSWSLDLACRLVTLGYPVDLEAHAKEAKDWPPDAPGCCSLRAMIQVFDRALSIAHSSVAAGTIKDPDTPANWIAWAEGKGYSVTHLGPRIVQAPNESAQPLQRQRFQEQEISRVICELKHDPKALPKPRNGKPGVKSEVRAKLKFSPSVFDKAWGRLQNQGEIKYAT